MGKRGRRFCCEFSIKPSVFSYEIVAYQELFSTATVYVLGACSAQPQGRWKRENKNKTRTLNVQHTFWQVSLPSLHD